MEKNNKQGFHFSKKIKESPLSTDAFLEQLRSHLSNNRISSFQTKEKTGEVKTTGVGMTMGGDIGAGIAHSDIITNKWNPFNITCSANKYALLGRFNGSIKVSNLAKYYKKVKDKEYEFKDYVLEGNIDFFPHTFWLVVFFFLGIYLSFKFSTGFWLGLFITFLIPSIFYSISYSLGIKELEIPKERINKSFSQFEKYLHQHNKEIIK